MFLFKYFIYDTCLVEHFKGFLLDSKYLPFYHHNFFGSCSPLVPVGFHYRILSATGMYWFPPSLQLPVVL